MQPKRSYTKKRNPGIDQRHSRSCASEKTPPGDCNCTPVWRASVFHPRVEHTKADGTKTLGWLERKTFPTLAAARQWRADAHSALGKGKRVAYTRRSLRMVADEWLAGAEASPPTVLNRSGLPYKPSAIRSLERDLRRYVLPDLGAGRLADVSRGELQALVDRLVGKGLSSSKVRNVLTAVRVVYRYAIEHDEIGWNPTTGLRLPNGSSQRERAASAEEASDLLAALAKEDRALYATAFYAGLRRGELRGLRWDDVDLAAGIIHVRRSWDDEVGEIEPKSRKGTRTVPIIALLRDYLLEQKACTRRDGRDFVFGTSADRPFSPNFIRRRAAKAWETANEKRAEQELEPLEPIGLHECRHTFVSLMFDAGLSLERIGRYAGHSGVYMTSKYAHLLEGHEAETARIFDEYLARADTRGRIEQIAADDMSDQPDGE